MALTSMKYNNTGIYREQRGYLSGTYTAASVTSETVKSATANADSVAQCVIASGVATITPGFEPLKVVVLNVTDRIRMEWHKGMNTGDYIKTIANGTVSLETNDLITVNATTGVVTLTFSGFSGDDDTIVYEIGR